MPQIGKADSKAVSIAKADVQKTKKSPSKKVYVKPATPKHWSEEKWVLAGMAANAINTEGELSVIKLRSLEKWLWEFCPLVGAEGKRVGFFSKKLPAVIKGLLAKRYIGKKKKSFKLRPRGAKRFLAYDRPLKVINYTRVFKSKRE
jgi:hypothetical protein